MTYKPSKIATASHAPVNNKRWGVMSKRRP
jgi:hypothetical protein